MIAYVAGHTHENRVTPFTARAAAARGGGSRRRRWPTGRADRLLEVMDNRDGTLSIFGTMLDAAAPRPAPAPGSAVAFDESTSWPRSAASSPTTTRRPASAPARGRPADQNVELLVNDPRRADLAVVKSDSPDPVNAGETLTYTLTVDNFGPSAASGVTVTDMLPASLAFDTATPSQGTCSEAAGTVTCTLGDLDVGSTATITITGTPTTTGTIVNQVNVTSNQGDDNPANNADTENTVVQTATGGYPRPKGATPLRLALVPAYNQCTSPNRTHGPPLAFPSCAAPAQSSATLTVGTSDANGQAANSSGSVRFDVIPGNQATPADEADVTVAMRITDVRRKPGLGDYTGDVKGGFNFRITDRWNNTVPGGGSTAATEVDVPFPVPVDCTPTVDPSIGSTCALTTTIDTFVPGAIKEGVRAIWEFGQFTVEDGGPDDDTGTAPNTVFARQGIFVP